MDVVSLRYLAIYIDFIHQKNKITLNEKPLESYKGREFAQW